MEGFPVLLTDFVDEGNSGFSTTLTEFLVDKKAIPFILVKDFETIHKIYRNFPMAIPVVLHVQQSFESTMDYLTVLPTLACVFNFDGEEFEALHRQAFVHDNFKSIDICRVGFEIRNIYPDLLEAVKGGYTLIINLVHIPMRGNPTTGMSTAVAASSSTYASSEQFKFVFEKLFLRNLEKPSVPCHEKLKLRDTGRQCTATQVATASTFTNPFSVIFRKLFTRFNPCAANTDPILNFHSSRRSRSVRSPVDRAIIIRSQQCQEIKAAFRLIHESACKNWIAASEENFKYTPEVQQQFREMCEEIERKGEEGRKGLMDKVSKDIERTKQWDHVLGPKTLENLRITKEKEVELKVQHFCKRKVTEAREKIAEEIRQQRLRMKTRFYREILDEQMMELLRLKEKYQQKI